MTEIKKVVLAILPKVSAVLSTYGSTAILAECFYFDRSRLKLVHHRILCLMAIFDLLENPWYFASTWALPPSSNAIYAIGNDVTCKAQAFFLQLGITEIILNACLSWYYLLVIRYSWSEEKIREKAAPWIYGTPIILGFGIALAGFPLNLYHFSVDWCWIAADADPPTNHFRTYRYILFYGPLLFFTLVTVTNTIFLIWTVWQVESASNKYLVSSYAAFANKKNRRKSNKKETPKKLEGEMKVTGRGSIGSCKAERMAELNRKLEEVRLKSSLRNVEDSHCTDSVLQLRRSKKNVLLVKKEEQIESQDLGMSPNKVIIELPNDSETDTTMLEKRSSGVGSRRKKKTKTRIVAEQSCFYLLVFFLTYGWSIVHQLLFFMGSSAPKWFQFGHYTFDPMQGFFNYIVYIRPRYLSYRRKFPELKRLQCLADIVTQRAMSRDSNADIENEAKEEIKCWRTAISRQSTGETTMAHCRDFMASSLTSSLALGLPVSEEPSSTNEAQLEQKN